MVLVDYPQVLCDYAVRSIGGRIVEATIKAVVETTGGVCLQVSFGDETALIYAWQIVIEAR
jgi:hypothetical protein